VEKGTKLRTHIDISCFIIGPPWGTVGSSAAAVWPSFAHAPNDRR